MEAARCRTKNYFLGSEVNAVVLGLACRVSKNYFLGRLKRVV